MFIGTASGVVKARTIKRLPPGERWTGNLLDEALGSELTPNTLEDDGGRVGWDQSASVATTRQFLCFHWCLKFDKCDERRCAELTLNGVDTQTIALDVSTQEQVVNKRWIIQNSVVLAWKQSCRRAPKVTNGRNKHAIVFARAAKELEDEAPQRKRHRLEGERGAAFCAARGRRQQQQ